jgi:hypothetical protein
MIVSFSQQMAQDTHTNTSPYTLAPGEEHYCQFHCITNCEVWVLEQILNVHLEARTLDTLFLGINVPQTSHEFARYIVSNIICTTKLSNILHHFVYI